MKRQLTIMVICMLLIGLVVPNNILAEGLTDVDKTQYKTEIEKLVEDGTITGYEDGTFRPLNNITRGELSAVLVRALDLEEDHNSAKHFIDVDGEWNQGYVGALYKAKILKGKSENTFGPNDNITRQELAVIIIRIFGLEETALELKLESDFKDFNEIPDWAKYSVSFANEIDLMQGIEENGIVSFQGAKLANRELITKLVYELKYNEEVYQANISNLKNVTNPTENEEKSIGNKEKKKEEEKKKEKDDEKPSYSDIVSRYRSSLNSLQSGAMRMINSIITQGKAEYEANKGKPGFSASALYDEYLSMAMSEESAIDSQVSSILSELESELSSHGYDASSAIERFQSQYEAAKDSIDF